MGVAEFPSWTWTLKPWILGWTFPGEAHFFVISSCASLEDKDHHVKDDHRHHNAAGINAAKGCGNMILRSRCNTAPKTDMEPEKSAFCERKSSYKPSFLGSLSVFKGVSRQFAKSPNGKKQSGSFAAELVDSYLTSKFKAAARVYLKFKGDKQLRKSYAQHITLLLLLFNQTCHDLVLILKNLDSTTAQPFQPFLDGHSPTTAIPLPRSKSICISSTHNMS